MTPLPAYQNTLSEIIEIDDCLRLAAIEREGVLKVQSLSTTPEMLRRPRVGLAGQALNNPAGADVHHTAVRLSNHLNEVGIVGPGPAFDKDHFRQISLLTRRVDRHHIADLDIQKDGSHELTPELFILVHLY